jgi:hypothetical protein
MYLKARLRIPRTRCIGQKTKPVNSEGEPGSGPASPAANLNICNRYGRGDTVGLDRIRQDRRDTQIPAQNRRGKKIVKRCKKRSDWMR